MNHIETFYVGCFRGLADLTFDGAGHFNLIVGGNNSGKTSALEALAVFAAPLDVVEWASVARNREVRSFMSSASPGLSWSDAVRWLFHQDTSEWQRSTSYLRLAAEGRTPVRSLEAACEPVRGIAPEPRFKPLNRSSRRLQELGVEEDGWHLSIRADLDPSSPAVAQGKLTFGSGSDEVRQHGTALSVDLQIWSSTPLLRGPRARGLQTRSAVLSPYSHRNEPLQMRRLSDAISSGRKDAVLGLLRGIDPELVDLEIIATEGDRPLLIAVFERSRRVPVTVLGDGFRRALAIAVAINEVRGGILMIDEIEAAMHVSALDTLFPWLLRSAAELEVQIFATTHSLEAIQEITAAVPRNDIDDLAAFHLPSRGPSGGTLRRYNGNMLKRLVQERGLDIR
ncbi:AAA family ATPase [Novosphingobium chloroacetimidivorans]|uniref:AAA family ATPase n=1 Tax=Novosphingobium chloroacetimidivorans TaxID=1428314 RepID=UPI00160CF0E3|nr:ATP-binding protein [Novosphingobium chloroacetimidivorans]